MIVPNQNFINQVITNYSRANNKLLDAAFPVRIQDIFHVDRITNRVVQYLKANPDVDSSKSTPVCYLKSVHEGGVQIAMTCIVRPSPLSSRHILQLCRFMLLYDPRDFGSVPSISWIESSRASVYFLITQLNFCFLNCTSCMYHMEDLRVDNW
ncbi:hypothetical protein Mapa_012514 [Marchantia paleacea]|nr:hypothetical protein Mapa_012514 [Marchantia paleacea]